MRFYEHIFIGSQDLSVTQAEDLKKEAIKIVEDNGGKVSRTEYWGLRNLAYKIDKSRKGHYFLLNVTAEPKTITELERQLRINENVIRFLSIKVDELDEQPSVMMNSSNDNDDRPRRHDRDSKPHRHDRHDRDDKPATSEKGAA